MSSPQVLRIAKKNGPGHLLVHITPEENPFDLRLVGTDTSDLFESSIKDSETNKLQASHFPGTSTEWRDILAFVLLHERPDGPSPAHLEGVGIVAEIVESTFIITIRKIVGAITQTLGRVELQKSDAEAELFDWIDAAATSSDLLRLQLQSYQTSSTEQQNQIARLTAELEQLSKAKRDHEKDLLSKCAALLNEKKLKIRDQQRLLSHAKVDPGVAEDVRSERSKDQKPRRAGASQSKRKAIDEDSDHAVTEEEAEIPAASDQETADEGEDDADDDEGGFAPASIRRSQAPQSQSQPSQRVNTDEALPPPRQLPFNKPRVGEPAPPASSSIRQPAVDKDDDTEDDEL
ncbi:uncharacterized protein RCC_09548 [Ramularia collo-cygni]|uniref:Mitotic apparatus protein p62 n=1 Tax=Ramularia collo-cygni TaxID=112498 RepID=A0A2D3VM89_9PEZI|nr:uncharacterized protein RCC_09548 [Ramularia collo-cygni]CZT23834.1 uncharacterized protein RCC_09548 [Ramularia collo-cygni]